MILAACSNTPSRPTQASGQHHSEPPYQYRAEQLANQDQWRLRGKLGFRSPARSGSGFIDWQQENDKLRIKLSGPLGQGTTIIEGDGADITLEAPGENGPLNPVQLLQREYGWQLPTWQLRFWVRGLPAPASPHEATWDAQTKLLQTLKQDEWQLEYSRYSKHRTPLPEKLILIRDSVKLTLIIKRWN